MDAEVRLVVGQTVEVALCDDKTYRNSSSIREDTCFTTRDVDTCYCFTFGVLTNDILFTTIVVGLVFLLFGKGQRGDICLSTVV